MLGQRLLFGTLLVAAAVALVVVDGYVATAAEASGPPETWYGQAAATGSVIPLLFASLTALGVAEMGRLARSAGHQPMTGWVQLVVFGLMIIPWVSQWALPRGGVVGTAGPVAVWLTIGVLGVVLGLVLGGRTEGALADLGVTLGIMLYVGLLGSFAVRIRCEFPGGAGAKLVLYFILTVKSADIGAYLGGQAFGRRPLAPRLSPKKTREGFACGVVLAAAVGTVMPVVLTRLWPAGGIVALSVAQALVFALVMSVVGQLGDLAESLLKRSAAVKDSGALVPTFGGALDLIDSPLAAAPIAWTVFTLFANRLE